MENTGLVFSGGGGRGAYQIGVWAALEELGFTKRITAVSGSSVGALNAALYTSVSCEKAAEIWCSICQSDLTDMADIKTPVMSGSGSGARGLFSGIADALMQMVENQGVFSREGLSRLITENAIDRKTSQSAIRCFACRADSATRTAHYTDLANQPPEKVTEILLDSTCIPLLFRQNGGYIDGGVSDNVPVKPLYDLGLRRFIVLLLRPDAVFDESQFPDSEFLVLRPGEGIFLGYSGAKFIGDGTADFNGENAYKRIALGYEEGMEQLKGKNF
ncbi:MAG: patatin-like phospholipase family protein [Oscillospiraceae bacterium]